MEEFDGDWCCLTVYDPQDQDTPYHPDESFENDGITFPASVGFSCDDGIYYTCVCLPETLQTHALTYSSTPLMPTSCKAIVNVGWTPFSLFCWRRVRLP